MKEYLNSIVSTSKDPIQARNVVREYLQARILECLQRAGAFIPLALQGGTALRFLYSLRRYSEDLDFSLDNPSLEFDFQFYLEKLKRLFVSEGYQIEISFNSQYTVQSAFLKFEMLLFELGLSAHENEKITIKIKIDTNPPAGAGFETNLIRKYIFLNLHHYDRASLFAGKLHALLSRKFTKGRDVYDLLWYLSDPDWPAPNFIFLKNALMQTGWTGDFPNEKNWHAILNERLSMLDWQRVVSDVSPFLEDRVEVALLTKANLSSLLQTSR